MDTPDEPASESMKEALGLLGLDQEQADQLDDGSLEWTEDLGDNTLPRDLPKRLNGAKALATAVAMGEGFVQVVRAYPLSDGDYLVLAIETQEFGRTVTAWHGAEQRYAYDCFNRPVNAWTARIGWKTRARWRDIPSQAEESGQQVAA